MPALPPTTLPAKPVAEIATYGATTAWVDPKLGLVVRRGATASALALSPKGVRDLDLGPAADGTPTAVYVRCAPGCDVYAVSLKAGAAARETRVPAAEGGALPTLWKGTLAFTRAGWVRTTRLGDPTARAKRLTKGSGYDDMELGPRAIAFAGAYDSDEGNGETAVDLLPLSHPGGTWSTVDRQVVGEGSAAGYGGLTAAADGSFTWQRAFQAGCAFPRRVARRGSLRRAGATIDRASAPLAARYAAPAIPSTPESEDCEDG